MLENNLPELKLSSKLTPITSSISQIVIPHLDPKFTLDTNIDVVGIVSIVLIALILLFIAILAIKSKTMGTSLANMARTHIQEQFMPLITHPHTNESRYCQPSAPTTRLWPALPPADEILKLPARLPHDTTLSMDLDSLS